MDLFGASCPFLCWCMEMVPCTWTQITNWVPLVTQTGKKSHIVALFTEKDSYTNLQKNNNNNNKNEGSQGYNFQSIFCTSTFSFTSSASHGILYKFFYLVRQLLKVLVAQTQFEHKYGEMPENSFPLWFPVKQTNTETNQQTNSSDPFGQKLKWSNQALPATLAVRERKTSSSS